MSAYLNPHPLPTLKRRVDAQGYILDALMTLATAPDLIPAPLPPGLYRPRWNGAAWVEGEPGGALAAQRYALIGAIKREASRRILDRYPLWKQMNMIAEGLWIAYRAQTGRPRAQDPQRAADLEGIFDWVVATRQHSDALEAQAQQDPDSVNLDQGWPL